MILKVHNLNSYGAVRPLPLKRFWKKFISKVIIDKLIISFEFINK